MLWLLGLMWVLNRKGIVSTSPSSSASPYGVVDANGERRRSSPGADDSGAEEGEEPVSEIVVKTGPTEEELAERARLAALAEATTGLEEPLEDEGPPTYPVWFESERKLGVCKINWEGGSKTANLHVNTRLPEGKLSFSYRCGKHSGRGSIDVKPKRVNGVLFCEQAGGVKVKTVRRKDGRCARR